MIKKGQSNIGDQVKLTKKRSIESVKHRFKLVNSERQLRRWASQINKGGTYKEKLYQISEFVFKNLKESIEAGHIIHDIDIRRWALEAKNNLEFNDVDSKQVISGCENLRKLTELSVEKSTNL